MNNKILALLGFASKSGKLSYGMNKTEEALKNGVSRMVIMACDTSEKSKKEAIFRANKSGIEGIVLQNCTAEQLSHAVGRSCSVLSVNDTGFAQTIKEIGNITH